MAKYIFLLLLSISCISYAQETFVYYPSNVNAPLTQQEKAHFEEVFGVDATFVMEKPSLLKDLKDLLRNRIRVKHIPHNKAQGAKKYREATDLSVVPLYTAFNPNIKRDLNYTQENFNILKYKIGFFPEEKTMYRLGNYYISVLPQVKNER